MKIEVEGSERELQEIMDQLEKAETFDVEASWVDRASQHEMDTAELAFESLKERRGDISMVTVSEVADQAGLPRGVTENALEDLGLKDRLYTSG